VHNNLGALLSVPNALQAKGVGKMVFSSLATVYGDLEFVPLTEAARWRTCAAMLGVGKASMRAGLSDTGLLRLAQRGMIPWLDSLHAFAAIDRLVCPDSLALAESVC
jgi:hypothetical protein